MTILVTGATGNVGSQVVRDLAGRGAPVRAFVRDPDKAHALLGKSVELAVGDFSDPASLQRALEGVDQVFLSSANGPQQVEHETAVIDAAVTAGVRRIVKASAWGAEAGSALPGLDWNGRIEDHLRRAVIAWVSLQSNFYMTNLLLAADEIRAHGKVFAPAGDAKITWIDPRDTGSTGAAVLTSEGGANGTLILTGSEALTYDEIAEVLAAATGRLVEFVDVPEEAARAGLVEAGMPDWLVQHLVGAFRLVRSGAFEETTHNVRELTGREPRTFAEFARDHAGLFGAENAAPAAATTAP